MQKPKFSWMVLSFLTVVFVLLALTHLADKTLMMSVIAALAGSLLVVHFFQFRLYACHAFLTGILRSEHNKRYEQLPGVLSLTFRPQFWLLLSQKSLYEYFEVNTV